MTKGVNLMPGLNSGDEVDFSRPTKVDLVIGWDGIKLALGVADDRTATRWCKKLDIPVARLYEPNGRVFTTKAHIQRAIDNRVDQELGVGDGE